MSVRFRTLIFHFDALYFPREVKKEEPARLHRFFDVGGEYRTRTCDPLHVKQML